MVNATAQVASFVGDTISAKLAIKQAGKEALLENGSSTNPKAIPDSPFWVVTNNNTAKKTNMLEQVLRNLGYQPDVIETVIARFSSEGK